MKTSRLLPGTPARRSLVPSALLGLAAFPLVPAFAQILTLDEFVITAQKYEQAIQDVPIAVAAYDETTLDTLNITDLESMAAFVPNLEIQEQSPNNPGFVIRGITSDSGAANIEPRVSVFQDGVSISKSRGSYVEIFDMERVEVLRGPQGTLFGRGAQIGAVHLIQNKAQNDRAAMVRAAYGEFDEILLQAMVNTPVVEDSLFVRAAVSYRERSGYIDNTAGGDLNGKDTTAVRLSAGWQIAEETRLDFIFNFQEDNYPGTSFKSGTYAPPGGDTNPNSFAGLNRAEDLRIDRTVWGLTAIYTNQLSDAWSLTSTTAYREFDSYEEFDADGTLAFFLEFAEDATGDQFSQEFRFNFDDGGNFIGFAGISYFWEDGAQRVPLRTDERSVFTISPVPGLKPALPLINPNGTPNIFSNLNPLSGQPFNTNYTEEFTNFGENSALEAFIDGTWKVSDQFEVTAGLRGTHEDITSAFLVENNPNPFFASALTGQYGFALPLSNGRIEGSDTFDSIVGRLIGKYKFSDDANVFASISRGRRPNVINADNDGTEILSDEIVWSYEVGYKGVFAEGQFSLDANLFYYDYANFQTSVLELQGGVIVSTVDDNGNATAWGFETQMNYRLNPQTILFFNYGYVDATFDDTDDAGNDQELAGNRFRLTPENSFALGADFIYPLDETSSVFFAPNFTWKSQLFFEEENQPGIEQDSYGLLNATAGYRWDSGRYEISLYGSNLLDEDFIIDAGNTGGSFGIPTFIAGPPRLYGIQFTGRF